MGSPLRILHVVVNMNRGGAETLIMNLYRNIDRSKVQFDFLTCRPGVFDDEIIQMGGKIHRIPYVTDVGHFKYVRELDQFFLNHKDYKIVHSHMDKMSGIVLRSAKNAGIPIRISHSHSTFSEGGYLSRVYKWYSGNLIPGSATNYMACSKEAAKWLFPDQYEITKILKNGIECEKFAFSPEVRQKVREEFEIDNNKFILGHVGRFSPVKNHSFLIDMFSKFIKISDNSMLILIGEGPIKPDIEKKVKELNLEKKVIFTGGRSDINQLLQAIDIIIFPSLYEGLPVSLIEAQAAGIPCLISNRVSPEVDLGMELVDFARLEEMSEWIAKAEQMVTKQYNRTNGHKSLISKGYDITVIANKMEEFYLTILG